MSQLPKFIRHSPRSIELVCLHEAGHVFAALSSGVVPEFVEVRVDPELLGRSRIPRLEDDDRKDVAASGFAVELWLFKTGRLVDGQGKPVSEQEFLITALGDHASDDKTKFFDIKSTQFHGIWPADNDIEFLSWAERAALFLDETFIEAIACELLRKRNLSKEEIINLADLHGFIV